MSRCALLFTRDLRIHDNPALELAAGRFDEVVPLFALDERMLTASPNRAAFLSDALRDLGESLQTLGSRLILRRGGHAEAVRSVGATAVVLAADASPYARRREEALRAAGLEVVTTPGINVHQPGELAPAGGDHYRVFSPYWRRWAKTPVRPPATQPNVLRTPDVESEPLPKAQAESPEVPRGGETEALRRLERWLDDDGLARYGLHRNEPAANATSRLSPYLHFGCLSPAELVRRVRRRQGGDVFLRQVCWRDFHTQLLRARPESLTENLTDFEIEWEQDGEGLEAWKEGRTGYPFVDAAMRQLGREGWIHGRARLVAASFLTKHLLIDWKLGERHYWRFLLDGDAANNSGNWQWAAGTGVDTRPYRILNPVLQGQRHDADGEYVRRYVEELSEIEGAAVHDLGLVRPELRRGYPDPIVDHSEAVERFRARANRRRP